MHFKYPSIVSLSRHNRGSTGDSLLRQIVSGFWVTRDIQSSGVESSSLILRGFLLDLFVLP